MSTSFTLPEDSTSLISLGSIRQHYSALTGSIGFTTQLSSKIYLNFNLGQAFRAPNLSDLSKLGESKGDTYEIPNPELKPERMSSVDLGVKLDTKILRTGTTLFTGWINDILASERTTLNGSHTLERNGVIYRLKSKQNIGNAVLFGIETFFNLKLTSALTATGNCAYIYGQNTTTSEPVGGIPPAFGTIGLRWQRKKSYLSLYSRFATKQSRLSADDRDDPRIPEGGTPEWITFNFRIGTTWKKWLHFQLGIENIFDLNYREHGSGINAPGRNVILTVSIQKG
jgi:outer membrane receptor protein involved in Fe transport